MRGLVATLLLRRALRRGVSPSNTHYYPVFPYTSYTGMSDSDIEDLWAYLGSVPPVSQPNRPHELGFPYSLRLAMAPWKVLFLDQGPLKPEPGRPPEWNRGRYLVNAVAHCADCHAPRNFLGAVDRGRTMSGTRERLEGYEVDEAANRVRQEVDPEANIIVGATFDESLEGIIRVSVVATGIDHIAMQAAKQPETRIADITSKLRADSARLQERLDRAAPAAAPAPIAAAPVQQQAPAPMQVPVQNRASVEQAAAAGELVDVAITGGELTISPLRRSVPDEAEALKARLYAMLPRVRVTGMLPMTFLWYMSATSQAIDSRCFVSSVPRPPAKVTRGADVPRSRRASARTRRRAWRGRFSSASFSAARRRSKVSEVSMPSEVSRTPVERGRWTASGARDRMRGTRPARRSRSSGGRCR